jgi:phosphatidylglycerol:prolipoprotein diacylglycerol transferase
MLTYPNIDPVAFYIPHIPRVGSWPVHWYGLMYLVGFVAGWILLSWRSRHSPRGFNQEQISDIVFYTTIGGIIGGRLGYMLFYDWHVIFTDPMLIFQTWKGGMSIHGGIIGACIAIWIYARKIKKPFLAITDFVVPALPVGLCAGRIGNFINDELWGRVTDMPWGMVFPNAGPLPRHPSQLYEAGLEGVVLFIILWTYSSKLRPLGAVSGLFAICYGVFRFFIECFREPDVQIGYIFGYFTEGQLLSLPLILLGIYLMVMAYKRGRIVS